MTFGVVRRSAVGYAFDEPGCNAVKSFCQSKRSMRESKCAAHYDNLFSRFEPGASVEKIRCPYGLVTTSAIGCSADPMILNGFWTSGIGDPLVPTTLLDDAVTTDSDIKNLLAVVKNVERGIRTEELEHFEAALHDTRHLNHSITQNAEQILSKLGWPSDGVWDMQQLQRDEHARRALTIYAASRDLSQSITMHEISRDPTQASRNVESLHVHKMFYRQIRISSERMQDTAVTYMLGTSNKTLHLSAAFRLIPKILLDNAIKYAARGSEIKVLFYESLQFFTIECRNIGNIVRESEISGLFNRGTRGSNKSGIRGQGIGLWLAKLIVEANSGRIEFSIRDNGPDYSGRRQGETIVSIKLPT